MTTDNLIASATPPSQSTLNNQASRTTNQLQSLNQDFNNFLILLTTQIQNQDPLNPTDSSEFTNQLVQFSQVEQQINTNQKLDAISQSQLSTIASTSLGFIGMDVSYPGRIVAFDGDTKRTISYEFEEKVYDANINIRDEKGNLVYQEALAGEEGIHEFVWDGSHIGGGKADPGGYQVSIDAFKGDGDFANVNVEVDGRVEGIQTIDGKVYVVIGEQTIPITNLTRALQPEDPIPAIQEEQA